MVLDRTGVVDYANDAVTINTSAKLLQQLLATFTYTYHTSDRHDYFLRRVRPAYGCLTDLPRFLNLHFTAYNEIKDVSFRKDFRSDVTSNFRYYLTSIGTNEF